MGTELQEAIRFAQPFIEQAEFYIPLFYWICAVSFALFIICVIMLKNELLYDYDNIVFSCGFTFFIISILFFLIAIVSQLELYDIKKFPLTHYYEKKRFVEQPRAETHGLKNQIRCED